MFHLGEEGARGTIPTILVAVGKGINYRFNSG